MRLGSVRIWSSVGALVLAAGMPYCAAAAGWAATQDATSVTIRADIAMGVLASWIGATILAIAGLLQAWRTWRDRRAAVRV
jgi:hypothetical protein